MRKRKSWHAFVRNRQRCWSITASIVCTIFLLRHQMGSPSNGIHYEASRSLEEGGQGEESHPETMIWSRQPGRVTNDMKLVRDALGTENSDELYKLCGRTLYHGIQNVVVAHSKYVFFSTGDLPLMWIRDSAFQIGVLIPKMQKRRALRTLVEGGIRMQAFYILQDSYANGFYPEWRDPEKENDEDRYLGRGGWVGVRNYELDSGCFFISLLWDFYKSGEYGVELLIQEPIIFDAVQELVDMWVVEQKHDEASPYSFPGLPNDGLGSRSGYTGMIWSGFRPSDDPNTHGYSIPSNMFAASSLEKAIYLNKMEWKNEKLSAKMTQLLAEVEQGIQKYGIVEVEPGVQVYAYEVDGLGNALVDFDDPNWPSLVSVPLLGWNKYDPSIYETTKSRILSSKNRYYFKGEKLAGLGSPHTAQNMVWALGIFSEALTSTSTEAKVKHLLDLIKLQCNDGLMHESIHVNQLASCTRKWFEWANALLVTVAEHLTGMDCDEAAEESHRKWIEHFEKNNPMYNGNQKEHLKQYAQRHQGILAKVQHDGVYVKKVDDWKGVGFLI